MKKILWLILIIVISCQQNNPNSSKQEDGKKSNNSAQHSTQKSLNIFSEKQLMYISGYTKIINPMDNISIRFNQAIDQFDLTGAFSISPKIKFSLEKKNKYEVLLIPKKPFKKSHYIVEINLNKIFSEKGIQNVILDITIEKNQITRFNYNLNKKGKKFYLTSQFSLKREIAIEDLKKAISIDLADKPLKFDLTKKSDGYLLTTSPFENLKSEKMNVTFDDKILQLSEAFKRTIDINSLNEMKVINIGYNLNNDKARIEITFSEQIDSKYLTNDYFELMHKWKTLPITLSIINGKVIIDGNIKTGESYNVSIKKGIKNIHGRKLADDFHKQIKITNFPASMQFVDDANILTSEGNNKIRFRSLNYKKFKCIIEKVYSSNLQFFLRHSDFNSNYYFSYNDLGRQIFADEYEINPKVNEWTINEIDLTKILKKEQEDLGMFIIKIKPLDPIATTSATYMISKNILITDLGISYKKADKKEMVVVTNLKTGKPEPDVKISIFGNYGELITTGKTNKDGFFIYNYDAEKYKNTNGETSYTSCIIAEKNKSRSLLKTQEMQWNTSTFDVGGKENISQINSFVYTERGVYRPGDEINFSLILRDKNRYFPANQPVILSIYNPKDILMQKVTLTNGKDGFYTYKYQSQEDDLTGNWKLSYESGGIKGNFRFKIEAIVAERLKLKVKPTKTKIFYEETHAKIETQAKYLFGAVAKNLDSRLVVNFSKYPKKIKELPDFSFEDKTKYYYYEDDIRLSKKLDENGEAIFEWKIPNLQEASTSVLAKSEIEVMENGGRASRETVYQIIEPFKQYVGIKLGEHLNTGENGYIEVINVDPEGNPIVGEDLKIKLYRNSRYWWWDRNDRQRDNYKSSIHTELVFTKKITSDSKPLKIEIPKLEWGQYLVEVSNNYGHTSAQYFYPLWYGERRGGIMSKGVISIKTDKEHYTKDDVAKVQFDAPENCNVLVSIEKDNKIIDSYWATPEVKNGKGTLQIKLDKTMIPNIYVAISVFQKVKNDNDLPIRNYGIVPIKIKDKNAHITPILTKLKQIKPNSSFDVEVQIAEKKKAQLTIAIIDEGLLSLTDFSVPDPYKYFYQKTRLLVSTYDNYGFVMGIPKGDVYKSYSIGGALADMEMAGNFSRKLLVSELIKDKEKRFQSLSIFSGIVETDENGYLKKKFTMPNYIGAVRIMVVAVNKNSYGSTEETIPVKDNLMINATLPRKLSPEDEFEIPIEIFSYSQDIKEVNININATKPIQIEKNNYLINMKDKDEAIFYVKAKTLSEYGQSHITINASSTSYNAFNEKYIQVYSSNPNIHKRTSKSLLKGKSVSFKIPSDGFPGTMTAQLELSKLQKINISERLNWLIRYPYGCLEQTISAVFPQLYFAEIINSSYIDQNSIDKNINDAIQELRKHITPDGGLSYWPGENHIHLWASEYAIHFVVEAKKRGYYIQEDFYNTLLDWLEKQSFYNMDDSILELTNQVYQTYILSLAGRPNLKKMNIIYSNYLSDLPTNYKWLLAASLKLAGDKNTAKNIYHNLSMEIELIDDNEYLNNTWSSMLREKSILLLALNELGLQREAKALYEEIAGELADKNWYSTQSLGFALTACGNYYLNNKEKFGSDKMYSIKIYHDNAVIQTINNRKNLFSIDLSDYIGETIDIAMEDNSEIEFITASLDWDGVPINNKFDYKNNNLELKRTFFDSSGKEINPSELPQGTIFECKIEVKNTSNKKLENLALVQNLPSGWEIVNNLSNKNKTNVNYDYRDIRDDKVMWFFNLSNSKRKSKTFNIKLRAVTKGKFYLPTTYCESMYDKNTKGFIQGQNVKITSRD